MPDAPLIPGHFLRAARTGELANLLDLATEPTAPPSWQVESLASLVGLWLPGEPQLTADLRNPANQLILATTAQMVVLHLNAAPATVVPPPPPEHERLVQQIRLQVATLVEHLRESARDLSEEGNRLSDLAFEAALALGRLIDNADPTRAPVTQVARTALLFPMMDPARAPREAPSALSWWSAVAQALLSALDGTWSLTAILPELLNLSAHLTARWPESRPRSPWPLRNLAAALQPLLPFAGQRVSERLLQSLLGRAALSRWFQLGCTDLVRVQRIRESVVAFDTDSSTEHGHETRDFAIQLDAATYQQALIAEARELHEQTGIDIPPIVEGRLNEHLVSASEPLVLVAGLMWNNSTSGRTFSDDGVLPTWRQGPSGDNPRWLFNYVGLLNEPEDDTEPHERSDAPERWE